MGVIAFLLAVVVLSYRQTIKAYPKGGGSYIVAKDNLGPIAGLVAGAALMTDYILTVAVSVASGYDQIQSVVPAAVHYRVVACIAIVVLIALANLRGLRQAGNLFAAPTYLFILAVFLTVGVNFIRFATGGIHSSGTVNNLPTSDLGTQLHRARWHGPGPPVPEGLLLWLRGDHRGRGNQRRGDRLPGAPVAQRAGDPDHHGNPQRDDVRRHHRRHDVLGVDIRAPSDPCYQSVILQQAAHAFTAPLQCVNGHPVFPSASAMGEILFVFTGVATTAS